MRENDAACAMRVLLSPEKIVGLRALARALERDVKSVHRDVKVLTEEELVDRDEAGRVYIPFDRIHAEFEMACAAA